MMMTMIEAKKSIYVVTAIINKFIATFILNASVTSFVLGRAAYIDPPESFCFVVHNSFIKPLQIMCPY